MKLLPLALALCLCLCAACAPEEAAPESFSGVPSSLSGSSSQGGPQSSQSAPFPIPADEVVEAMRRVGRQLPPELRETAQGGIADTETGRAIAARLAQE